MVQIRCDEEKSGRSAERLPVAANDAPRQGHRANMRVVRSKRGVGRVGFRKWPPPPAGCQPACNSRTTQPHKMSSPPVVQLHNAAARAVPSTTSQEIGMRSHAQPGCTKPATQFLSPNREGFQQQSSPSGSEVAVAEFHAVHRRGPAQCLGNGPSRKRC